MRKYLGLFGYSYSNESSVKKSIGIVLLFFAMLFLAAYSSAQEAEPSAGEGSRINILITDGHRLLQRGDLDKALKSFEEVLKIDSSNAEALYYAGTIYIRRNNMDKGVSYLERSAALEPNNARLQYILAQTYEHLSKLKKAIDAYHRVEKIAPNSTEAKESDKHARILQGRILSEQGDFEQALKTYSEILTTYPNDVTALMDKGMVLINMGRLDEAKYELEKALAIQPNNVQINMSLADLYEKKGDIDQSKKYYQQALRMVSPDSSSARLIQLRLDLLNGAQLLANGELDKAQRIYDKVLDQDPHNFIARFNLARIYHDQGNLSRAMEMLVGIKEDNPTNMDVRLRLAALYLERNELINAVRELEYVIAKGGETPQARQAATLLVKIRSTEKNKLEQEMTANQRIDMYRAILKQNPDDREVWLALGLTYIQQQKRVEAREAFENAIRLDANDPRALAVLGGLYEDTDMPDKALETYQQALDMEKDPAQRQKLNNQLLIVKGRKAFVDGNMKKAEEYFKQVIKADDKNYNAHFYLALVYSGTDRIPQAIPEYQEVLRLFPGHLSARLNLAIAYEQSGRDEDAITEYQFVERSGVPDISETARKRLDALKKRVGGFTYNLGYSLNFDSNSNFSSTNPVEELRSDAAGSIIYRHKVRGRRIYWGLNIAPTYSVYHQQQVDFLQTEINPFISVTNWGFEFSGNYDYSQTDSVLVQKNYNKSQNVNLSALKRYKMRSLLPFLTAKGQREATPSAWRLSGNYRHFTSDTSPIYDSDSYSIGMLLNQGSSSGWAWTGNYSYYNNNNLEPIGNDFAFSSHGINFQLSKEITPKFSANGAFGFIYSTYKHPDSVTKFTEYRVNKYYSISAGLNYTINDTMRLYGNVLYQRNDSNLPTGFILSSEDAITLIGVQSPSLGDYRRYGVTAGLALNF